MTALHTTERMTVAEFLAWAEGQPGRYELWEGRPIAMSPERIGHGRAKRRVANALDAGIVRPGLQCEVLPDGITVIIDGETAFEPDALVYCGELLPDNDQAVRAPIIVVEVASPSTKHIDSGMKLEGYFSLPSVMHYLILNPEKRSITHHARKDGVIETTVIRKGEMRLDPPGIAFDLGEVFGAA